MENNVSTTAVPSDIEIAQSVKMRPIEDVAQVKLHHIGERLHLTTPPNRDEKEPEEPKESSKAAKS